MVVNVQNEFLSLLIALGLGLLVGLQRERTKARLAGVRTFALITLFGTLCAILGDIAGEWIIGAGLVGVAAASAIGNLFSLRQGNGSPGVTTEIAMLVMFGVGALLLHGPRPVAVAIGGGVAVLLHAKPMLHSLVAKLGDADVHAIMQFAIVTLVILPVLPDREYGPYGVLNPRHIWLMVALVVGISLAGYLLYRFYNGSGGVALAGLLGGLISSTATTVSYARRAKESPEGPVAGLLAVIMIASTVVYGRVLTEIGLVAPAFLPEAAGPIGVAAGVSAMLAVAMWWRARQNGGGLGEQKNPSELKSALVFGGLYALILLAVAAAKANLGDAGLYGVAAVSGLTDMDSITLSVSRMVEEQGLEASTAWRCVLIAAMSNMVAKGAIVGMIGGMRLFKPIAVLFGIKLVVVTGVVLAWPW